MRLNVNEFIIIELVMTDDRFKAISEFFGDDDERLNIVSDIVAKVLSVSKHESTFKTFVNIELDSLIDHLKEYESLH